jgi:O-methyltransferase involved in polyketide biosynthesis
MSDPAAALDLVEETALLQACWRAAASRCEPPRLADPLACEIADTYADREQAERFFSGPAGDVYADIHVSCTLATDEQLGRWIRATAGPKQIAILGCGFDGRVQRCRFGSEVSFFLVDRRRVLDLLSLHVQTRDPRVDFVEANLGDPVSLFSALASANFRCDVPTAFVVEGVAEFLGVQRTRSLVRTCRERASPGSLLLLQLLDPNLVSFAAHAGDAAFPWRKLPATTAIMAGELACGEQEIHAKPPWNAVFAGPLAHVFAIPFGPQLPRWDH